MKSALSNKHNWATPKHQEIFARPSHRFTTQMSISKRKHEQSWGRHIPPLFCALVTLTLTLSHLMWQVGKARPTFHSPSISDYKSRWHDVKCILHRVCLSIFLYCFSFTSVFLCFSQPFIWPKAPVKGQWSSPSNLSGVACTLPGPYTLAALISHHFVLGVRQI